MRKSSWNLEESIAGSLQIRLQTCRRSEWSYGASPVQTIFIISMRTQVSTDERNWTMYLQKATCSWHNVVQHLSGWMHMGWHRVSHIPFWIDIRWWCRILMQLFNIFMALCIPVKWAATAFPPGGPQSSPISSKHDNSVRRSLIWNFNNFVTLRITQPATLIS